MVKVGDKVIFNMESKNKKITQILNANKMFGKELTVRKINDDKKSFYVGNIPYMILEDDNWDFVENTINIILKDCSNDEIYGILKVDLGINNDFKIEKIQEEINKIKDEIGAEFTVNDVLDELFNRFDNIVDYETFSSFLEI